MGASLNSTPLEYLEQGGQYLEFYLPETHRDVERHVTYMFTVSTRNPSTPLSSQKRMALS